MTQALPTGGLELHVELQQLSWVSQYQPQLWVWGFTKTVSPSLRARAPSWSPGAKLGSVYFVMLLTKQGTELTGRHMATHVALIQPER